MMPRLPLRRMNCRYAGGTWTPGCNSTMTRVVAKPLARERFVNSVTRGKNQMPPWGDFFKPEQLEALWAYVMAGER